MRRQIIILLIASLAIFFFTTATAYASIARDYDMSSYSSPDTNIATTPHASTAAYYQGLKGYTHYAYTEDSASDAYSGLGNTQIFYFIGHGNVGLIDFNNQLNGNWITDNTNYGNFPNIEAFSNLNQLHLAVFVSCYSGSDSTQHGCMLNVVGKGAQSALGFSSEVAVPQAGTWSDRFWDRMHSGDTVLAATSNACAYTALCFMGSSDPYGGTENNIGYGNGYLTI